jgi:hypothetical protein
MAEDTRRGILDDLVKLPWVSVISAAFIYAFVRWGIPQLAGSSVILKAISNGLTTSHAGSEFWGSRFPAYRGIQQLV